MGRIVYNGAFLSYVYYICAGCSQKYLDHMLNMAQNFTFVTWYLSSRLYPLVYRGAREKQGTEVSGACEVITNDE